jgi:hypothetical protein
MSKERINFSKSWGRHPRAKKEAAGEYRQPL